jgi:hypothetical protein
MNGAKEGPVNFQKRKPEVFASGFVAGPNWTTGQGITMNVPA